ncbi:MAG: hypothetical protein AAFP22_08990 [Planctomycetota bacterium]
MDAGPRGPFALAALVGIVVFAMLAARLDFVCDDAYITFRYARNWADGHGLVYHVGTDAPVEGYSEFLWALFVGVGMKLGIAPEIASRVVSYAAGAALVVLVARASARRFGPSAPATFGATLFAASAPPISAWSSGGMATMPAVTLGFGLFLAATRRVPEGVSIARAAALPALLASALALTRADGALQVALVLGPLIALGAASTERRRNAAVAFTAAIVSAAAFGVHVLWRSATYGDWMPNTARVKLGFSARATERGLDYVIWNLYSMPGIALAVALGLVGLWLARRALGGPVAASCAMPSRARSPTPLRPAATSCASRASSRRLYRSRRSAWRRSCTGSPSRPPRARSGSSSRAPAPPPRSTWTCSRAACANRTTSGTTSASGALRRPSPSTSSGRG